MRTKGTFLGARNLDGLRILKVCSLSKVLSQLVGVSFWCVLNVHVHHGAVCVPTAPAPGRRGKVVGHLSVRALGLSGVLDVKDLFDWFFLTIKLSFHPPEHAGHVDDQAQHDAEAGRQIVKAWPVLSLEDRDGNGLLVFQAGRVLQGDVLGYSCSWSARLGSSFG